MTSFWSLKGSASQLGMCTVFIYLSIFIINAISTLCSIAYLKPQKRFAFFAMYSGSSEVAVEKWFSAMVYKMVVPVVCEALKASMELRRLVCCLNP